MTWIFTYGSLMGDNALRYHEGQPALLTGHRRAFNHESTSRWGTPGDPCPILGLSPDGECWGVAFDIPKREERDALRQIARRESQDQYLRQEVAIQLRDAGRVQAWVWVTKPELLTRPRWPDNGAVLQEAFRRAHGFVGTGVEYIRTLIHAMERWRIHDETIETLWQQLLPHSNPKG